MMPSILFINRVYPPDEGATGRVLEHVAGTFVRAGWDVSVLSTASADEAAGQYVRNGVRIIRCGARLSKKSLAARAFGYALMLPMLAVAALRLPRIDVVVTKSDPPMLSLLGVLLRCFRKSLLIHWAQDLYPEVAEEAGVLAKGGVIASLVRGLSTCSMRRHDLTVAVGRCMASRIRERGIPSESIRVVPNTGIEREIIPQERGTGSFRTRHGLEGAFVVEYSGNLGRAHEFATVLDAASVLRERGIAGVVFLFVGSGPGEAELRREVTERGLGNVRFLPMQPFSELSATLGAADLHLVTMKPGMSGLVVPSKFYGVMAAHRPCLFVGPEDSEVARVILREGTGRVITPGDAAGLVSAIMEYRASPDLRELDGERAGRVLAGPDGGALFLGTVQDLMKRSGGAMPAEGQP